MEGCVHCLKEKRDAGIWMTFSLKWENGIISELTEGFVFYSSPSAFFNYIKTILPNGGENPWTVIAIEKWISTIKGKRKLPKQNLIKLMLKLLIAI